MHVYSLIETSLLKRLLGTKFAENLKCNANVKDVEKRSAFYTALVITYSPC